MPAIAQQFQHFVGQTRSLLKNTLMVTGGVVVVFAMLWWCPVRCSRRHEQLQPGGCSCYRGGSRRHPGRAVGAVREDPGLEHEEGADLLAVVGKGGGAGGVHPAAANVE